MKKYKKPIKNEVSLMASRIMERIKAENINPRPRSYFVSKNILLGFGIAISLLLGVFFVSLVFYQTAGIRVFGAKFVLLHFPWFASGLALSLFLVTFALFEYYKIFYKLTLSRLAVTLLILFIGLGMLLSKTQIHQRLQNGRLAGVYSVEEKPLSVYAGRIVEVRTGSSFILQTLRGENYKVYATGTKITPENMHEGQALFIAGYKTGSTIIAKGILTLGKE